MKKIEQKVLKFINEKKLIEKNDKVLVALSGGPDSVFLLHFLKKYSAKFKITFGAVHINHLLRELQANKDELFCKQLSEKLDIPFYSVRKNVKSFAVKEKVSTEEAGRIIRYKEFERIALKKGYTKIATAHNCDDNAETVLLNLIKGAGLRGISGIPPFREKIIRPILALTKEEIFNYLNFYKIKYRTDRTNLKDDYERNFLRNQVIPLIKKRLNPSLSNTLLKSSEIFRDINSVLKKKIDKITKSVVSKKKDHISLSLTELKKNEKEYWSKIFRFIFEKEFKSQISFDDCKKIISLIDKQAGKSIQIFNKIKVIKERNELIIQRKKSELNFKPVIINKGEKITIDDKKLSITEVEKIDSAFSYNKNIEFISGDITDKNFRIRRWLPGDRFYPFGMKGSKKVSDFLNEQKISSFKKKEQMILLNNNRIVWVIGLRLDNRFRINSSTKKILELCLS